MPRRSRRGTAGLAFHVMNRGARRLPLFEKASDYRAFLHVLRDATDRCPMRLLCYAVMPNHWHLVLWPRADGDLSTFMAWLTATHSRRWHLARHSVGTGTIYQGRFKAIPVKDDAHLLTVCRYVERNPVRAGLVSRVEDWEWCSAFGSAHPARPRLDDWPIARPRHWVDHVNAAETASDLEQLREAISRSTPYGPLTWRLETARGLGWCGGLCPRGRPSGRRVGRN